MAIPGVLRPDGKAAVWAAIGMFGIPYVLKMFRR